jgi:hypothetical protein
MDFWSFNSKTVDQIESKIFRFDLRTGMYQSTHRKKNVSQRPAQPNADVVSRPVLLWRQQRRVVAKVQWQKSMHVSLSGLRLAVLRN